jgi:hypothetical protein
MGILSSWIPILVLPDEELIDPGSIAPLKSLATNKNLLCG